MTLWHYTCSHRAAILGTGEALLRPGRDLAGGPRHLWPSLFVWVTDMTPPIADALGLTRHLVTCDRTAYRYRVVDETTIHPWINVARSFPRELRDDLEGAPGAMPRHWFVSRLPVPVVYDPEAS